MTDWDVEGGGHQKTYRGTATSTVTISAGAALSGVVDVTQFSSMSYRVAGTAWTGGTMAFKGAHASTQGTFYPVCGSDGALERISTTFGTIYHVQDSVAAQHYVKFWSEDGAGGTKAQAAQRTIRYYLKA